MENPALFILAVLAILSMPGPTNTLLASSGATVGVRRSLSLVPAEAAGYLISIMTVGLIVGPALASSPAVSGVLRATVGVYLVLLAIRLWRKSEIVLAADILVTPSQVFVTTLLNPKGIVLALGVVPFQAPRVWPYLLGLVALIITLSVCWSAVGALLGRAAHHRGYGHMVPRVSATAVGMFAVLIVVLPLLR